MSDLTNTYTNNLSNIDNKTVIEKEYQNIMMLNRKLIRSI